MTKWIFSPWAGMKPKEFIKVRTAFLYFAFVMAAFITLKSARNAQFLSNVGVENLPYLYIVMGLVLSLVAGATARLIRGIPMSDAVTKLLGIAIGINAILWVASLGSPGRWFYWIFYLWVALVGYVLSIYGWLLWNEWFTVRDARRIYWLIGLGGLTGASLGGLVSGLAVQFLGEGILIPLGILYLGLGLLLLMRSRELFPQLWKSFSPALLNLPIKQSRLKLLLKSRYMILILGAIFLTEFSSTWIEYLLQYQVQRHFGSTDGMARFFGWFYSLTNLAALLLQVIVTRVVIQRFGLRWALFILPVSLGIFSIGMPFAFGLAAVTLLSGLDSAARHTINRTSYELLYLPVPKDLKQAVRGPLEALSQRSGMALAGIVILLLSRWITDLTIWQMIPLWAALSMLLVLCQRLYAKYVSALKSSFKPPEGRRLRGLNPSLADPDLKLKLGQALRSQEESEVLGAMEFMEFLDQRDLLTAELAKNPSPLVRQKALQLFRAWDVQPAFSAARMLLNDPATQVRAEAINLVFSIDRERGGRLIEPHLYSPNPVTRSQAAACLARGDGRLGDDANRIIKEMCASSDLHVRREGARAVSALKDADQMTVLMRLLEDRDKEVVINAMEAAELSGRPEILPQMLRLLARPGLRRTVEDAVERSGEQFLDGLEKALIDSRIPLEIRRHIPGLLRRVPTERSVSILVRHVQAGEVQQRFQIIKALNRLKRDHGDLLMPRMDQGVIRRAIIFESQWFRHLKSDLMNLEGIASSGIHDRLLVDHVQEHLDWTMERIFRLLGLIKKQKDIHPAYLGYRSKSSQERDSSIEYLDNILDKGLRSVVMPILEWRPEASVSVSPGDSRSALLEMIYHQDRTTVVLSLKALKSHFSPDAEEISAFVRDPDPLIQEALR